MNHEEQILSSAKEQDHKSRERVAAAKKTLNTGGFASPEEHAAQLAKMGLSEIDMEIIQRLQDQDRLAEQANQEESDKRKAA